MPSSEFERLKACVSKATEYLCPHHLFFFGWLAGLTPPETVKDPKPILKKLKSEPNSFLKYNARNGLEPKMS